LPTGRPHTLDLGDDPVLLSGDGGFGEPPLDLIVTLDDNARFAVPAAQSGSAFTPIPGVNLDDILCVQEERQVGNDNCVSYRTLKLQIPESPMRPHFVRARVKVHLYPDGSHALFHGPRCIGRYDARGALKTTDNARCAA
jgi:hypothetical protein